MATLTQLIEQKKAIDAAKEKLTKHSLIIPLSSGEQAEIVFKSRSEENGIWVKDEARKAGVRIQYRPDGYGNPTKQLKIPFELLPSIAKLIQELKIDPNDEIDIED